MRRGAGLLGTLLIALATTPLPRAAQSPSVDATVAVLPTAWTPVGVTVSGDGRLLYVEERDLAALPGFEAPCLPTTAPAARGQVEVFETSTRSRVALRDVATGGLARDTAVDPLRHVAYVARAGSPDIDVIDVVTRARIRTIDTGLAGSEGGPAIDPARRRLYVMGSGADALVDGRIVSQRVRMIDLASERPVIDMVLPDIRGAHVDPATGRLWVLSSAASATGDSHVAVFDPHTLTEATRVRVGRCASGLAFDQVRQLAYVTSASDRAISVIDMTRIPARASALPAPAGLRAIAGATAVGFIWPSVPSAAAYDLEIGSRSGASDLAVLTTTGLGVSATLPASTSYARVRAKELGGAASVPSNEIVVVPPAANASPAAAAPRGHTVGPTRVALAEVSAGVEGRLWEHFSTVGRWALTRCVHPPTAAFPTGDYHMAVVCPPGAPLEADEILNTAGVAVFDPGPGAADRAARYRVYAADPGEGRVIAFDMTGAATVIGDARSFRQQYQFTPPSTGRGPASSPGFGEVPDGIAYGASGVAIDAAGNLLVAELDGARVEVFGPDGAFRFNKKIGPADRVRELRPGALGVAITPGTVVAAPATDCTTLGAGRIAVSTQFNALYTSASHSHILPQGLRFEDMAQMHQILVFDEKWCEVSALGQASQWGSDAPGSFRNPEGLAFDTDGRLVVADAANGRIQIFAPAAYNDPVAPKTPVLMLDDIDLAVSVVLDADGRLIVPDTNRQRLTVYELSYPQGAPAGARVVYSMPLSRVGAAAVDLAKNPRGIAIDADGRLFIGGFASVFGIGQPDLAIHDLEASVPAVQSGGQVEVSYSITVPKGKGPVAAVVPAIAVTGATAVSGPVPVSPSTPGAPVDLAGQQTVRYRTTFVVTAAASELVTFRVSAGNATVRSPARTVDVRVVARDGETTAPAVSARLTGNQHGGVYTGPVTVTLTARDASGVGRIWWRFISGPHAAFTTGDDWNNYDPIETDAEHDIVVERTGTTELRYWAVDAYGIKSAEQSLTLVLDVDGPSLFPTYTPDSGVRELQGEPWWTSEVLIGVNASDTTTADAAIDVSPKEAVLATAEGQVVAFTAVDQFGHRSTFSVTARIDRSAPTVAAVPAAGSYGRGLSITAQAADTASGIASLEYSLAGAHAVSRTIYTSPIVLHQTGSTTLTIYSSDWAGRTTQASFVYRIGN